MLSIQSLRIPSRVPQGINYCLTDHTAFCFSAIAGDSSLDGIAEETGTIHPVHGDCGPGGCLAQCHCRFVLLHHLLVGAAGLGSLPVVSGDFVTGLDLDAQRGTVESETREEGCSQG